MKKPQLLARCFVFLYLLLAGSLAYAAPCTVTFVNLLVGTTCEIGDKTFQFTDTLGGTSGFIFTPDASAALAPAFTITPVNGSFILESGEHQIFFWLGFYSQHDEWQ